MNNLWLIAEAEQPGTSEEGTIITSDDIETSQQQQSITQADGSNGDQPTTVPPKAQYSPWQLLLPIMIMVMLYMMLFRGPRKKQQQQQQMIQSLQKNDRVRTIGGIIGTVIDVKGDEVVLKVDESNNTKMKFTSGAVAAVLSDKDN